MIDFVSREPVAFGAVARAALYLFVAFGLDVDEQTIVSVAVAAEAFAAVLTRGKVSPV